MNDSETDAATPDRNNRRAFLNRAGKVAVTAPAAALLLAASTRPAAADALPTSSGGPQGDGIGTG